MKAGKSRAFGNAVIRAGDFTAALVLIVVLSPVMLIALVLSSVCIGFPPFYTSERRGKGGVVFRHVKIKSMKPGRETGRIFFEQDRLNGCGKFLRSTHLDELPELFHILTGRMSFVGPRPLQLAVLEILDTGTRETVPPGWTGTAQIWLLKTGLLSKKQQIRLDNYYVMKRSPLYNLRLVFATFYWMIAGKKADLTPDGTPDRIKFRDNDFKYK